MGSFSAVVSALQLFPLFKFFISVRILLILRYCYYTRTMLNAGSLGIGSLGFAVEVFATAIPKDPGNSCENALACLCAIAGG